MKKEELCQICEERGAAMQCQDCGSHSLYCRPCFDFTHKSDAKRFHKFHVLANTGKTSTPTMPAQELAFCSTHSDQQLKYYCASCIQTVCSDCLAVGRHNGHKGVPLVDAAGHLITAYEHCINEYRKLKEQMKNCSADIRDKAEGNAAQLRGIEDKTRAAFETLLGTIQEKKEELMRSFEDLEMKLQLKVLETKREIVQRCGLQEHVERARTQETGLRTLHKQCTDTLESLESQLKSFKIARTQGTLEHLLAHSSLALPDPRGAEQDLKSLMDSVGELHLPEVDVSMAQAYIAEVHLTPELSELLPKLRVLHTTPEHQQQAVLFTPPNLLHIYSPVNHRARTLTLDKHYGLTEFQLVSIDNILYFTGGQDLQAHIIGDLIAVELADLKVVIVTQLEPMINARTLHGCVATLDKGRLCVVGGVNSKQEDMDNCEMYEIHQNKWTEAPKYLNKSHNLSLCAMPNSIFAFSAILNHFCYLPLSVPLTQWQEASVLFPLGLYAVDHLPPSRLLYRSQFSYCSNLYEGELVIDCRYRP